MLQFMRAATLSLLFLALLCSGADSQPWEPNWRVAPIRFQLANLSLSHVSFRDADLVGALRYLQRKAEEQSRGALKVAFVLDLPADFKPRYELSLDASSIPFAEALRYLGEQAGLQFSQVGEVIHVRREGQEPTPPPLTAESGPRSATTPIPGKNPSSLSASAKPGSVAEGTLGKPAEAIGGGGNVYRNTSGEVQPDKSGFVPRRGLNGYSDTPSMRGFDVNCARPQDCKVKACGCNFCSCAKR